MLEHFLHMIITRFKTVEDEEVLFVIVRQCKSDLFSPLSDPKN